MQDKCNEVVKSNNTLHHLMGQNVELKALRPGDNKKSTGQKRSKLVKDIIRAVKKESLGFSDDQLLPAIDALIETYGTDDAYKWITEDNFAVLVNFILESPYKALDGCTASLFSAESMHRKHKFDRVPVRHSDKSIELGSRLMVRDKAEQGSVSASKLASLPLNVARKKQHKVRYLTAGDSIAEKAQLFNNYQDDISRREHTGRKFLEESEISQSIDQGAELAVPLLKKQKVLCGPSHSPSALPEERPSYGSEKLNVSRSTPEHALSRKHGSCTDTEASHQEVTRDFRTSKTHSNVVFSKLHNHQNPEDFSDLPVKRKESSRHKSLNGEGHTVQKKYSDASMDVKQSCSINSKNVDEENKLQSKNQRKFPINNQALSPDELPRSLKERCVGNERDAEGRQFSNKKGNSFMPECVLHKPYDKSVILPGNIRTTQKTKAMLDQTKNQEMACGSKEQIAGKASGKFSSSFLEELKIAATGGEYLKPKKKNVAVLNVDNKKNQCSLEEQASNTVGVAHNKIKKTISLSDEKDGDGNLLSLDLSRGLERKKITCVNEFDNAVFPEDFLYINQPVITADAHVDTTLSRIGDMHCSCFGNCLTSTTPCKCTNDTRGEYAYDKDGLLISRLACNYYSQDRMKNRTDFITECNIKCRCSAQCGNRVVQRGLKYRLQVFMTKEGKGWGVRSLEAIPARSFLFEYIGEIMTNIEQYHRNEEYARNNIHTYTMLLDADYDMETKHFTDGLNDDEALTLDATRYGNVSRFVNHRCTDPNLFIRPVQIETRDTHYYHVAFFACRDISVMEELTWDYGINFDDQHAVRGFRCLCGSEFCRDRKNKDL